MEDYGYLVKANLEEAASVDDNTLTYLLQIAHERTNLIEEKEKLEEKLKEVNGRINELEQKTLPNAMYEKGMTSLELANGYKLKIQENINCTVKDMGKLIAFLDERGDSSLINTTMTLGKVPPEIGKMIANDLLTKYSVEASPEYKVHPMTLKAYFKRLCGIDSPDGTAALAVAEIDPEMVSVHTYYKVVTTKK
jgi:predicted nuclease with TOPRIM domain